MFLNLCRDTKVSQMNKWHNGIAKYILKVQNIYWGFKMYIEGAKCILRFAIDISAYNKIHIEGLQRLQKLQGFRQTLLKTRTLSRKLLKTVQPLQLLQPLPTIIQITIPILYKLPNYQNYHDMTKSSKVIHLYRHFLVSW